MTREEQIQEAKDKTFPTSKEGRSYESAWAAGGFEMGAHWADEHPNLSSLWHDASEEPKEEEFILIEVINTRLEEDEVRYFVKYLRKWVVDSMKTEGFKCRWAYIKDLLPKGGEK